MKMITLCDVAKAVIKGKCIAIQAFLKKEERSQIHNLTLRLNRLQIKSQTSRKQEIIKIRAEINAIKTKTKTKQNKNKKQKTTTTEQIN